jgi:hypothetical protein
MSITFFQTRNLPTIHKITISTTAPSIWLNMNVSGIQVTFCCAHHAEAILAVDNIRLKKEIGILGL